MTNEEAFRLGFFAKCAEAGLSPTQVAQLTKRAMEKQANPLASLGAGAGWLLGTPTGLMAATAALAPPAAGYLGGAAAANISDETLDPKALKKQELLAEYKRMTNRIRLARKQRELEKSLYGESS